MGYQIQISANILNWPQFCACCGELSDAKYRATASRTNGKRVQHTVHLWWEVPYCSSCLKHIEAFNASEIWISRGVKLGIVMLIVAQVIMQNIFISLCSGALIFLSSLVPYFMNRSYAKSILKSHCCAISPAVVYTGWYRTIHTFVFNNRQYLDMFVIYNSNKKMSDIKNV